MSKFADRTRTALLVIDVQNDVVVDAWNREEVIGNINSLVAKARAADTPVIWVQHSDPYMEIGTEPWKIVSELQPNPGEPNIRKKFRSSFEGTDLDETLATLGVGHLVISGSQTDYCVRHTSHAALERGYDVTLVADAHTTSDGDGNSGPLLAASIVDEMNRAFQNYKLPERSSKTTTTAAIAF